jgi:immune inhibitor A
MRRIIAPFLSFLGILALLVVPGTAARPATSAGEYTSVERSIATRSSLPGQPIVNSDGTIDIGPVVRNKEIPLDTATLGALGVPEAGPYGVGDTRLFVVLNYVAGQYQLTEYTVRYKSDLVEVWVQSDLRYLTEDGDLNPVHPDSLDPLYVTQERIDALARATEEIIPVDVEYFGDYADRTGEESVITQIPSLNLPPDYYAGPAKSVVVLVSNVRDENFYEPIENPSYVAGFFSPTVNDFADRNIITIDSKRFDVNTGSPSFQNEATIAHEFQHLINGDTDPDGEDTWANEGRSELAEFINGYRPTPEDHRTQWSDYPENSLTVWGDQDGDPDQSFEILADYQQVYWFQLYLAGRLRQAGIGTQNNQYIKLVSRLTSDPKDGIESTDAMLASVNAPFRFADLWEDFRTDMLFGGTSDQTEWGSYISQWEGTSGVDVAPLDIGRMRRNLNFEGYDTDGAPPYGSDYIEIGWSPAVAANTPLSFNGDGEIPSPWSVVPLSEVGVSDASGGAAPSGNVLYSGHTDFFDTTMVVPVSVPTGSSTLTFDTLYNIEAGWDYGIVQVSTDGGDTFRTLPIEGTTDADPETDVPQIVDALPGFTGVSGSDDAPTWLRKTYRLDNYGGDDILLMFRYAADQATAGNIPPPPEPGWYIDNLSINSNAIYTNQSSLPSAVQSIYQVRGNANTFKVDFVTFADKNGAAVAAVTPATINASTGDGTFNLGSLLSQPGFNEAGERVVALVSVIPPAQDADLISSPVSYASYTMTGLPPSLYTSRARAIGDTFNTSLSRPRTYPDDDFTLTVTLDNLGRNDDLQTTGSSQAYVAVPIPANTTFVEDSFVSDVSPGNFQYVENLSTLGSNLPAGPGVYWNGTVADTADLEFELTAGEPLAIGTLISPTTYIANAPFNANPSQFFSTLQTPVQVVSPFSVSSGTVDNAVRPGQTASFTYTLINTDDETREADLRITIPDGTTLTRVSINNVDADELTAQADQAFTFGVTVPSYEETGQVTVVTFDLDVPVGFRGANINPEAELFQPGSDVSYGAVPLNTATGDVEITGRVYMPLIFKGPPAPGTGGTTIGLSGANEVPPVPDGGTGSFAYTYNTSTRQLSYTLTIQSATSPIVAAHIHRGAAGQNGPIAYGLYSGGGTLGPGSPLSGSVTLSESDAALLASGGLYVNVHSERYASGEMRGQLFRP